MMFSLRNIRNVIYGILYLDANVPGRKLPELWWPTEIRHWGSQSAFHRMY